MTAAHLSNDNSKTKGVSTLNQVYPSEGVFSLNIDSKDGVPIPLCHALQSHKFQEAKTSKNGRFLALFVACLLTEGSTALKGSYSSALIWRLCPCLSFVAVAITLFEIESRKAFSHCLVLKRTAKSARKSEQNFVVVKTGLWSLRSLQNLLI